VRTLLAGILLLVGALLVPVATAGWWARDTIVPAQAYVDTVSPLATDPAITKAVETQVVDQTMAALRTQAPQLPDSVRSRVKPLMRGVVHRAVASPAFEAVWRRANLTAHRELVGVLTGRSSAVESGHDGTVAIRLGSFTQELGRALTASGIPFSPPATSATVPIGSAENLQRAQGAYQFLVRWGRWLSVLALVLVVAGLLVARRRASALAWTAVVALLGLGALALALYLGRGAYLDALPPGIPSPAGKAFFDTVTSGLRHDIEVVSIGSAVVLIVSAAVALIRR
jgi:voltage-gated potassium channel Kch